uniref:Uncharacterized protein n=1 Tax=Romanomermis culicivorax TaxID=13658 RepID=A0A915JB18_ROMCU
MAKHSQLFTMGFFKMPLVYLKNIHLKT